MTQKIGILKNLTKGWCLADLAHTFWALESTTFNWNFWRRILNSKTTRNFWSFATNFRITFCFQQFFPQQFLTSIKWQQKIAKYKKYQSLTVLLPILRPRQCKPKSWSWRSFSRELQMNWLLELDCQILRLSCAKFNCKYCKHSYYQNLIVRPINQHFNTEKFRIVHFDRVEMRSNFRHPPIPSA